MADKIIQNNAYIVPAYKVRADNAFYNENWKEMCENQKKIILLQRYNISRYEDFVFMISNALDITIKSGKQDDTRYLIEQLKEIQPMLEQTIKSTSSLAYKIVDKPKLELKEEIVKYLQEVTSEKIK